MNSESSTSNTIVNSIAIIGMSGRFPGANDIAEFWDNLISGKETIKTFGAKELAEAGLPESVLQDPNYVPARGVIDGVDRFDASFFSYSPREAELLDPQHRVFLECAWTAIEDAGYDPLSCTRSVGVFAGANQNTYLLFHLLSSDEVLTAVHGLAIHSDKDFLATRASYKLDLQGPSVSVQCACSTSLVCVHLACQSLLSFECDMALAAGVSVVFPQAGYFYQKGGVFSPDGHCRTFDRQASGTLGGDGVGVVLLKRLEDALRDGDYIYATILGTAINNDGIEKASFAAPSVNGQARVIMDALAMADVDPQSIGYVETHGTGTPLGDPIEITALTRAFKAMGYTTGGACAVGSLKPNIGHLDQAAGVANLIKAALVVKHGLIPPTLHFQEANPEIDFASTPFHVNTELTEWSDAEAMRRASVSSFGFGGTNAHAIIEQARKSENLKGFREWEILPFSARTESALESYADNLAGFFSKNSQVCLADTAYVLQTGRTRFPKAKFFVARSADEALTILTSRDTKYLFGDTSAVDPHAVYFLFPGQGSQYPRMGRELYESEPVFRQEFDIVREILQQEIGVDLRTLLFADSEHTVENQELLNQTRFTQPALFAVEYALSRLWMSFGVQPAGMIGHSLGEWVAACLAGVFTLRDALRLVALRGELMQSMPKGEMLAVTAPEEVLAELIHDGLSLAAVNAPNLCVLSGDNQAIAAIETNLLGRGYQCRRLHTSHAFHSNMMEPIVVRFAEEVASVPRSEPRLPFISNVHGDWITSEQAVDPNYWAMHIRNTVHYSKGIGTLLKSGASVFLEVGPGHTLATLTKQNSQYSHTAHEVVTSMRHATETESDQKRLMIALGKLWLKHVPIDWKGFRGAENRKRLPLPTYPFERLKYFVPPRRIGSDETFKTAKATKLVKQPIDRWLYLSNWTRAPLPVLRETCATGCWLVLSADHRLPQLLARHLVETDVVIHFAILGTQFLEISDGGFQIRPNRAEDMRRLLDCLQNAGHWPDRIIHAFGLSNPPLREEPDFAAAQSLGVESLAALIGALVGADSKARIVDVTVVSSGLQDLHGTRDLRPNGSTILGPCRVIPHEYRHIRCRNVDFALDAPCELVAKQLSQELLAGKWAPSVAYRDTGRFIEKFEQFIAPCEEHRRFIGAGDVILITGGMGEVGLTLAEYLSETYQPRLVLMGRTELPPRETWEDQLQKLGEKDPMSRILARLIGIGNVCTDILTVQADVSDEKRMKAAFDEIHNKFGGIQGVFHAAGVSGADIFKGFVETEPVYLAKHYRAKVDGLRVLRILLKNEAELRFCVLQSSLFSVLGVPGCSAYTAASIFMDRTASALAMQMDSPVWLSISWDAWLPKHVKTQGMTDLTITAEEVGQTLERIFALGISGHVLVSTCDLQSRMSSWFSEGSDQADQDASTHDAQGRYERPNMATAYVEPESEIEKILAENWQELLGITQVGTRDDFFELGGHSLLATQVVARIQDSFPVEFQLHDLVEHPTIADTALMLEERLIEKIDSMSEDEVALMIQEAE